ncbi:ankyrin repeat domain-containing protein [Dyella terrae]|uniref:Ankyrin repeat domain-containing protein n=3 Tax=Dyella TaxID=231454 RepID=A0A4R0YLE2_9GAMM|nr:ankyrin repeat domain-containing protein [Dyella soli]TBR36148.1 ankyrin repeat domain-containing protein [Dyella terrae]TCI06197.1 ankyrin repeat domain-containing protein [Dyella soli]
MQWKQWIVLACAGLAMGAFATEPKFELSRDAGWRAAILRGDTRLLPPPERSAVAYAIDLGYFDVALLRLRQPGVSDEEGQQALYGAIQNGNESAIRLLLAAGVSPDAPYQGWYFLPEAAKHGRIDLMCLIADYGAHVSLRNTKMGNVRLALVDRHIDAAMLLMQMGYQPDKDEMDGVRKMGARAGTSDLYEAVLKTTVDPVRVAERCRNAVSPA